MTSQNPMWNSEPGWYSAEEWDKLWAHIARTRAPSSHNSQQLPDMGAAAESSRPEHLEVRYAHINTSRM
jgi:hypothetical protein